MFSLGWKICTTTILSKICDACRKRLSNKRLAEEYQTQNTIEAKDDAYDDISKEIIVNKINESLPIKISKLSQKTTASKNTKKLYDDLDSKPSSSHVCPESEMI